jgi:hypothetical protein
VGCPFLHEKNLKILSSSSFARSVIMEVMIARSSRVERGNARLGRSGTIWGIRFRILFWYVLILGLALSAAVFVVRRVLIVQLEERIDEALVQEISELRRLARGRDPLTGERFHGDVERIFDVFLRRNIPEENGVPGRARRVQERRQRRLRGSFLP